MDRGSAECTGAGEAVGLGKADMGPGAPWLGLMVPGQVGWVRWRMWWVGSGERRHFPISGGFCWVLQEAQGIPRMSGLSLRACGWHKQPSP